MKSVRSSIHARIMIYSSLPIGGVFSVCRYMVADKFVDVAPALDLSPCCGAGSERRAMLLGFVGARAEFWDKVQTGPVKLVPGRGPWVFASYGTAIPGLEKFPR